MKNRISQLRKTLEEAEKLMHILYDGENVIVRNDKRSMNISNSSWKSVIAESIASIMRERTKELHILKAIQQGERSKLAISESALDIDFTPYQDFIEYINTLDFDYGYLNYYEHAYNNYESYKLLPKAEIYKDGICREIEYLDWKKTLKVSEQYFYEVQYENKSKTR